ncbi:hypothetical protein AMTRI_Chr01g114280 [Amborella trichopoda]
MRPFKTPIKCPMKYLATCGVSQNLRKIILELWARSKLSSPKHTATQHKRECGWDKWLAGWMLPHNVPLSILTTNVRKNKKKQNVTCIADQGKKKTIMLLGQWWVLPVPQLRSKL